MAFDFDTFSGGLGGFLGGLFGNGQKPHQKGMDEYQKWINQAQGAQQPYSQAGQAAIPDYQNWLKGQQDPSQFVNNLMGQYSESPHARYMQQQSMNAGQNAASASGLTGSTPMMQQMQQNAGNIASQDQNQWLQNVLGVNTQYGQGQQNLINGGQNSANQLTSLFSNAGNWMGQSAYGKQFGKQKDTSDMISGIMQMFGMFL